MNDIDAVDSTQDTSQPGRRRSAIRPVTIRQLAQTRITEELTRNGSRPRYSLDDDEFSIATFVGNIVSVAVSGESTRKIRIEDGTGRITSTQTIKEDEEMEDLPRAGTYVRVFGVPREFRRAIFFDIYFIRPLEDYHEVFFHLMEAVVITLQPSRSQPPPSPPIFSKRQPSPVPSTSHDADDLRGESQDSVVAMPSYSPIEDSSDDGDGSTEYYTDPPPDSPLELSPSPTPRGTFARNHSYEGHSDREEGPSSQSTQRPGVQSTDEEDEDGWTSIWGRRKDDNDSKSPKKGSDDELDLLRSEISSQITPFTPPKLKPDPYSGWSPAKRKILVFVRSKTPGEEVNIKRSLSEGMSKMEMRNAIRELVKEGEIETVDGMNYRLTDKGPSYPRF